MAPSKRPNRADSKNTQCRFLDGKTKLFKLVITTSLGTVGFAIQERTLSYGPVTVKAKAGSPAGNSSARTDQAFDLADKAAPRGLVHEAVCTEAVAVYT